MEVAVSGSPAAQAKKCVGPCLNGGHCHPVTGQCVCPTGWVGTQCQHCGGRFRLTGSSGFVTDGPGNYKYKTKCSWLIEGQPHRIMRLRFNHFATECGWDNLYVYDGDSIYAPLIAAFSGLIVPERDSNEIVPEVVATSGYALLQFFSDAAYNLSGFNLTYSFDTCPYDCSGRGECTISNGSNTVECDCSENWKGESCDIPYCSDNCGFPLRGICNSSDVRGCSCFSEWQGPGCSIPVPANRSFWTLDKYPQVNLPRASHKAVVNGNTMWIVGGYMFNNSNYNMVLAFDLVSREWLPLNRSVNNVTLRYGHSLVLHKDKIYMYGGKIDSTGNVTNELRVFHIRNESWALLTPKAKEQYAVVGHSAHIITLKTGRVVMLVIFGHCPLYGYISNVQEYDLDKNTWHVLRTHGALVQGGYGHSSVYDHKTKALYVHGGYKAFSVDKYGLAGDLYKYDVDTQMWIILKDSQFPRFLHTAVIVSGTMLVFGGNTHNDTSMSRGAKCFSSDFMAYDIACDRWSVLPRPDLHRDVSRFGHSAVLHNNTMYVFGGFSSLLFSDILVFTSAQCEAHHSEVACMSAGPGIRCVWDGITSQYISWELATEEQAKKLNSECFNKITLDHNSCDQNTDCYSCTANTNDCHWCSDHCVHRNHSCTEGQIFISKYENCPVDNPKDYCNEKINCRSCNLDQNCQWMPRKQECIALSKYIFGIDWHLAGNSCLKITTAKKNYDNAKLYCKNHKAFLASLTTQKKVEVVLKQLRIMQSSQSMSKLTLTPWVGLWKSNVSHWYWEDKSPFTNSLLQWMPSEPSDAGFCGILSEPNIQGLKAATCSSPLNGSICEKPVIHSAKQCQKPCALKTTCRECTSSNFECMWCNNMKQCVDFNAYLAYFPFGQCTDWYMMYCPPENCSGYYTCSHCLNQPGCGWCTDSISAGKGKCMEGSYRGPVKMPSQFSTGIAYPQPLLNSSICLKDSRYNWSFIHCPAS